MAQETGWFRIDNYAICDNIVNELCHCKCVKNYVNKTILICTFSTLLKTYKDEPLSFVLSNTVMFTRMLAKCQVLYSFLSLAK